VLTKHNTSNNWHRIGNIVTETGAKIQVTYSLPECTATNLPAAAHTNTKLCYPVIGEDPIATDGSLITEWWHKYVVRQVSESDTQLAGGHQAPVKNTFYTYGGSPAWHYADDDGLTKPRYKTWNQFRGYETVTTRVGETPGRHTLSRTTYLRGMHGDRAAPSGGTRTVTVPATLGSETVHDHDQFAGMTREEVVYNGIESRPVSKTVMVPWLSPATAARTINGDTVSARFVDTTTTYQATALGVDGVRGWRTSRTTQSFSDRYGTVEQLRDDGDVNAAGDERCTTYGFNRNDAKNIVRTIKRTTVTALPCGSAPTTDADVISDERVYYDGASSVDTAPTAGSVTRTEKAAGWAAAGTVWRFDSAATFDGFGRVVSATDRRGNTTTTAYAPATGPVTATTTTSPSPFSWVTVTAIAPYWGATTRTTDPNNRVTEVAYDPLGRTAKVWQPGWARADHPGEPSAEYEYVYAADRGNYPYIRSKTLHAGGGYRTTFQIFDAFLRPRQTQAPAVGGGRVVTDTVYDDVGRAAVTYGAHAEPDAPSGTLWWEPEWSLRAVTKTEHDGAGRPTADMFYSGDGITNLVEKWRTTTVHEGDLVKVTPPAGGTPTTTKIDIWGHTVELRQHTTAQGVAGPAQTTRYTYNRKGQLVDVADPAGNQWRYTYDFEGREVESVDPDKGTAVSGYDAKGDRVRVTDGRGKVLAYTYDQLGRRTGVYDDTVSAATRRAEWRYDRLYTGVQVRGQLTEAIRFAGGQEYKRQVVNVNARYQETGVNYVVPFTEAGLGGTYTFSYGYSPHDGSPVSIGYPAAGDLPAETVTTGYDEASGLPVKLETNHGQASYVTGRQYTAFGEPTLTTRKIAGGVYVQDAVYFDGATRRVSRTTVKPETGGGTVSDRAYGYDPAGNITSVADTPQVGAADTQCFRHDALRRLVAGWTPKAGITCAADPAVADLGGPAPYWLDWTFDAVGNRLTQTVHTSGGNTVQTSTVPAGGTGVTRPHAVTAVSTAAPGQGPVVRSYGYDNGGNTTSRPSAGGVAQTLSWDSEGRLDTLSEGVSTTTHLYDADGARLIRRDATGTTLYLPGQEVRRQNGTTTGTRYYAFGGTAVASRTQPGGLAWLYTDHQGTQQVTVNALTQQVTQRRQTPYGEPRGTAPAWPNGKGFVGGDNDPSGLVHIGAREYDAALGRFVSVDPVLDLADPAQWNAYAYARNAPVTSSDPTGMIPDDCRQFDCYGYSPTTGCQHGCGSTKNVKWGKANGLTSTKSKRGSYTPPPRKKNPWVQVSEHVKVSRDHPRFDEIIARYREASHWSRCMWLCTEEKRWGEVCLWVGCDDEFLETIDPLAQLSDTALDLQGEGSVLLGAGGEYRDLLKPRTMVGVTESELRAMVPESWVEKPGLRKGTGFRLGSKPKGKSPFGTKGWVEFNHGYPGHEDPIHAGRFIRLSAGGFEYRAAASGNPVVGQAGHPGFLLMRNGNPGPGLGGARRIPMIRGPLPPP
jgi:RHS repeat-associated protein